MRYEKSKVVIDSLKSNAGKLSLDAVASKLKGKELFPDKVEKAKLFFKKLNTASA